MQKFEWAFFVIGSDWFDIAAKDRLSRRQQVICEANDADGENGRCPAAS